MQRDKRGRFVKKADGGTALDGSLIMINGQLRKVKPGANKAYEFYKTGGGDQDFNTWISTSSYLLDQDGFKVNTLPVDQNGKISLNLNTQPTLSVVDDYQRKMDFEWNKANPTSFMGNPITTGNPIFGENHTPAPLIDVYRKDGKYVDKQGNELNGAEVVSQPHKYKLVLDPSNTYATPEQEPSAGMTVFDETNKQKQRKPWSINKTDLANWLELTRAGIGAGVNNKIAERALEAEKPFLQDVSESHRTVYGDYRSKIEGEKAAAQLRNMASKPITSDGALQQQMMLEAQLKGQEYIDKGNAADEAVIRQTREVAWEQEKENQQQRQAAAMANRQSMLMSQKNKTQIENIRDSANFSQVVSPLLAATEQRLRNKGVEQKYYQDYYDNALASQDVWNNWDVQLTDSQKILRDKYNLGGLDAVTSYVGEDTNLANDWTSLQQIMNNEIIKRRAAIKGVTLNFNNPTKSQDPYAMWVGPSLNFAEGFKKGGTIYKAKLSKRTKDNDRGAKSIESSKKIAARFLEKAIDSLYTYNDVELVARPTKKKRKYQSGGGLPFVNFTPIFATSETGSSAAAAKAAKEGEDLTTKDILELLKDIDGLPSDIDAIQASLSNFVLQDQMDPLGLISTSSIATRYMNLVGKIKKAKANKEWYDKAYDKLRTDGALNEYAIDSSGNFIGMNAEGDFKRFSAQQIANKETGDYSILTNSNLLDIRAKYPTAAFNHNLIMEAANGVSMAQVTEHISKTIQGLGTDKTTTQIFGDQSKEVLAGLRQLQQAAQQVGQDLSISQLYEASVFTESQARQAQLALNYLYQTLPTNMQALLFSKTGSIEGVQDLIKTLVDSKLSSNYKLEFSPKKDPSKTGKSGKSSDNGFELSPAQMLQQGYGERESILIQDATTTGLRVEGITMPITKNNNETIGQATLEDVATSQFGGLLNFTNASMGGQIIPFEGRKNIAIDGSKIYSMYLPIDQEELVKGNIVPDLDLIDKVNAVNKKIKEEQITDPNKINECYIEAGLPVYMNSNGTVVPTSYRRFGVLNGTAIDNAFGKDFVASKYLKEIDDEDIIKGAISIMNYGRNKEDRIEYDAKNFFNFGGLLGDYDSVYQGTIFIPMSNDVFLGIAGSGKTIDSDEALQLEALQQQHQKVMTTYKNPGQLQ